MSDRCAKKITLMSFLEAGKKEKKHQHVKKVKAKQKQTKHLMMTRDYRSELVNTIKKKKKNKYSINIMENRQ